MKKQDRQPQQQRQLQRHGNKEENNAQRETNRIREAELWTKCVMCAAHDLAGHGSHGGQDARDRPSNRDPTERYQLQFTVCVTDCINIWKSHEMAPETPSLEYIPAPKALHAGHTLTLSTRILQGHKECACECGRTWCIFYGQASHLNT